MELVEFRSSVVSKTKFEDLISEVEGKLCESRAGNIDPTVRIGNIILDRLNGMYIYKCPYSFNAMPQLINRSDWRMVASQSLGNHAPGVFYWSQIWFVVDLTTQDPPVCDAASKVATAMVSKMFSFKNNQLNILKLTLVQMGISDPRGSTKKYEQNLTHVSKRFAIPGLGRQKETGGQQNSLRDDTTAFSPQGAKEASVVHFKEKKTFLVLLFTSFGAFGAITGHMAREASLHPISGMFMLIGP
ncbi:hypothetical protein TNCV_4088301 [Trichonephila clavipes]|nr:hypothetical protein TNCV_4088301 [Trichonephila clavipes]